MTQQRGKTSTVSNTGGRQNSVDSSNDSIPFHEVKRTAKHSTSKKRYSYNELLNGPHNYMADNEWITEHYRGPMTLKDALLSLFDWHNESMNVCTHALGALMFIYFLVYLLTGNFHYDYEIKNMHLIKSLKDSEHTVVPIWPMAVFLISAILCLSFSSAFHLLHVVSNRLFLILARLDYVGIALLIAGSNVPFIIYTYWCHEFWMRLYLSIQIASCTMAAIVGMGDKFQTPDWRLRRMSIFIGAGLCGAFPMLHQFLFYSHIEGQTEILLGVLSMGAQYIFGALLYGFRIPEKYFPGRFNLFFASHGIFHVFVWTAAYTHYVTVAKVYERLILNPTCPGMS